MVTSKCSQENYVNKFNIEIFKKHFVAVYTVLQIFKIRVAGLVT